MITGLEHRIPRFDRKFANLHYQSEITREYGTIIIRPNTTEDDIMNQYAQKFPRECKIYLSTIAGISKTLNTLTGMGKEGRVMFISKIPEIIYTAMKFLNEDYWMSKEALYRFIRNYPKFMIGDHRRKDTKGVIIK